MQAKFKVLKKVIISSTATPNFFYSNTFLKNQA